MGFGTLTTDIIFGPGEHPSGISCGLAWSLDRYGTMTGTISLVHLHPLS
jgi:hypothetical protein